MDIFVISRPKWLKFGVQAHLFKMFGHTKFQLSISCTFKVMKLLVEITKKSNSNFLHKWAYYSSSVDSSAKVHSLGHLVQTQKKALTSETLQSCHLFVCALMKILVKRGNTCQVVFWVFVALMVTFLMKLTKFKNIQN